MKHMIYTCDRCKKEYVPNHKTYYCRILALTDATDGDEEYDLCDDCYDSLEKWYMEGKKNNGCERTDQAV